MSQQSPAAPEIEAMRLVAARQFAQALPLAERAVAGRTVCLPTHGMLAAILLNLGRRQEAGAVISQALQLEAGSADAYDALAHVSQMLGQHERSNALYRRATELAPNDSRLWYNLASSDRTFGRLDEAERACDRSIALDKKRYDSYQLRSELRVQSSERNHVAELQSQLVRPGMDDRGRMFLGYALAKELDDLRRYDEAFPHLALASQIRRRNLAYDVAQDLRKLQRIAEVFPPDVVRDHPADARSGKHIFIVGLPRSGTTLLEHMLMGLPGVRSNGETENFSRAMLGAVRPGAPDVFAGAAAAEPAAVAAGYERLANGDSSSDSCIEKLPLNYLYIGAIRRALPRARVVVVNREPLDICFAMYRTLFGEAYPFSYDFDDLARYYAAYERLMNHWRACLRDTLHEISYEDLVSHPAQVGAGVAAYCGLQWRDQAVDVQNRTAVSLTASAAQVRRPIYGSSSGRWRHYRKHLQPLIDALRREHVSIPDSRIE